MTLSGELAKTLLELSPDATVIVDAAGTIVFANAQIERTFGYAPNELIGAPVETLLPTRFRAAHLGHRERFAEQPKPRAMGDGMSLFGQHKSGREFPVEISLSPARSADGLLIVAAVRDATARHDAQRELIEANRAKSRLLAAASHDLRQPVQTLSLLNQAAQRLAGADTRLGGVLAQQQAALDTMSALLTSVLDVSKLDSGAVKPAVVDCRLDEVFNRLRSDFGPQAEDRGLVLLVESTAAGGRTDPELLRRMLGNLLSNAIRYTPTGRVNVECARAGDDVALTVRDTGVGIPSEELGRIFEEFYQVDRGPQRPEGLGLGLSIVRRLAILLGHKVTVDSTVGRGTAFTITLPHVVLAATVAPGAASSAARRIKGTILVVDDETSVAHATSLLLELEGFAVSVASCRSEALERALAATPDLIISDYHLRGAETGAEVVSAVRARLGKQVPVIFVTGDTSKIAGTQVADATLLSKPTQVDELLGTIQRQIGRNVARQ
jgi:PAS domain S-box-containing protein